MTLHPQAVYLVPQETARVAHATFPRGSPFMRMRDGLGMIYDDHTFAALYPSQGQPAYSPFRLALTLVMQFAEHLSDRQAADAVRSRIDWKYALALELTDPGFDASVLSEFRTRIVVGSAEQYLLDTLLALFRDQGLLKARGTQRTDSTHVLAAVRDLNRRELVGETLRAALNSLAVVAPEWLTSVVPVSWYDRYAERCEEYRLPDAQAKRQQLAVQIGTDGFGLLSAITDPAAPTWLSDVPAVAVLRQVWAQQFVGPAPSVRWRTAEETPARGTMIASPYDPEARYGTKRNTEWVGYKVHITETCEPDAPLVVTQVTTTPGTTPDGSVLEQIQADLAAHEVTPNTHLVDTGYVDGEGIVRSAQTYRIALVGPVPPDTSWQARQKVGYAASDFQIDWSARRAVCPQGQVSTGWKAGPDRHDHAQVKISFPEAVCGSCAARPACTRATTAGREITVRPELEHTALQVARRQQQSAEWKATYNRRAGIEGSLSQGVRRCGLRRSRYIGLQKTHLQHGLTAVALNIVRVVQWLNEVPRAQTRRSAFARLAPAVR